MEDCPIFVLCWDKRAINVNPNGKVHIDHSRSEVVSVKPLQGILRVPVALGGQSRSGLCINPTHRY